MALTETEQKIDEANHRALQYKRAVNKIDSIKENAIREVLNKMNESMKDLDPEYSKLVDDNLWDLV
jgi:hypothetical protein